jgi:hypothetical protein
MVSGAGRGTTEDRQAGSVSDRIDHEGAKPRGTTDEGRQTRDDGRGTTEDRQAGSVSDRIDHEGPKAVRIS